LELRTEPTGDLNTNNGYNDVCFVKESTTETTSKTECSGNNCYIKEYYCDSVTGNPTSIDILCEEKGFRSCKEGECI